MGKRETRRATMVETKKAELLQDRNNDGVNRHGFLRTRPGQKLKSNKMRTKVLSAIVALSYAPLGMAGDKAAYPTEKVASFVVEKLDLTSLPSAYRPKKEKGKKTVTDYGFTAQTLDENEAVIEEAVGGKKLAIKLLAQETGGIYVCVAEPGENGGQAKMQNVILLKRKDPNALLKRHETWREFAACPAIGGSDSAADSSGY
jgi:hypothetical protein